MAGLLTDAEVAWMMPIVASSLDASLPLSRKTTASDGAGHTTETWVGRGNIACNIMKPSATVLQAYASIIASRRTIMLRTMSDADVSEGDRIVYDGLNWMVQALLDAESYTVTKEYLVTVVV